MADRKITQLQKLHDIGTGTVFIAVDNNITRRIDLEDITSSIDANFYDVHTVDGSANRANRAEDKDGNLYGKFRLVSGNFWVSGSLDQEGVHKGDGSIFKVTTEKIDMRSPERVRLDPTGNLSLGGSLHISGDNNTISGYGMVVRTSAWLQHPLRIDSDVTGAGQWNFTGTAGGKNVKFSAIPTVAAPKFKHANVEIVGGGGHDSVALSGHLVRTGEYLDGKIENMAQQIWQASGTTTTNYSLTHTGVKANLNKIDILSGSWIEGSGRLQAQLDYGCCDAINYIAERLGNYVTGFSGTFHVTGKFLNDKIDVLSGELLGSADVASSTGVYTRNNLASLNTYRAHKHTTGVFPAIAWHIPQPNYCFACDDNIYVSRSHYHASDANRKEFHLFNLNNNSVSGLHTSHTDVNWRKNEKLGRLNRLSNLIWVDVRGYAFSKKRTYQLATHYKDRETYQLYLGDTDSSDWGTPERLGTFKKLTNGNHNHGGDVDSHIIFVANPMTNTPPETHYPGAEHDVTGSNYCMFEFQDQGIDEDDDPLITGDIYSVHTTRNAYYHITNMRMYKRRLVDDTMTVGGTTTQRWYGRSIDRGISGTAVVDYQVNLVDYAYKGRDTFKENYFPGGHAGWAAQGIDLFQYNALKRRFYITFEDVGMIHQFTINDGFKGPFTGLNPNDPLRGVNYGGGHLPSWWLIGEERYNYLAYEQSFKPAGGGMEHVFGDHTNEWGNGIQFDPANGDEVAYMAWRGRHGTWTHKGGFMTYAPLVVPNVGRPIRNDGGPQRLPPMNRDNWSFWHEVP